MKKAIAATALFVLTSVAYTAPANVQPLNVKTGLWQITKTINWTGLPPQLASMNGKTVKYNSCVKTSDLTNNPWANGSDDKCTWTVVNSTGSEMEIRGTRCDLGKNFGMTADVHGKIHVLDPENGTGSIDMILTGNGQTMNGHGSYTGKWVNASCAGK